MAFIIASGVGGAISKCFFHNLSLNKANLKVFGLSGLQTAMFTAPSIMLAALVANLVSQEKPNVDDNQLKKYGYIAALATHSLAGPFLTVIAKVFMDRRGISMTYKEAFSNLVISSIFAVPAALYIDASLLNRFTNLDLIT